MNLTPKWKQTLKAVAPIVGGLIGGPLGSVAVSFIASQLNIPEKDLPKFVALASPENITALKKAEREFQLFAQQLDLDLEQTFVEDRMSARENRDEENTSRQLALITIVTMPLFIVGILALEIGFSEVDSSALILIGFCTATLTQVYNFYFGSSSSSKSKTGAMKTLMNKVVPKSS